MPPRASFDLNALWSAPPPPQPKEGDEGGGASEEENEGGDAMDLGTPPDEEDRLGAGERGSVTGTEQGVEHEGGGGDDLDFAMFLGQEEEDKERQKEKEKEKIGVASQAADPQVILEGLPHVWNGIVSCFAQLKRLGRSVDETIADQHANRLGRTTGAQGRGTPDRRSWYRVRLSAVKYVTRKASSKSSMSSSSNDALRYDW
jgi:hypothetical protein